MNVVEWVSGSLSPIYEGLLLPNWRKGNWIRCNKGAMTPNPDWIRLPDYPDSKPNKAQCSICNTVTGVVFRWPDGLSLVLCPNLCHRKLLEKLQRRFVE